MPSTDKLGFQGFGVIFQIITRSTATTPFLFLALIASAFSAWTGIYYLAVSIILGIFIIFAIALFVDDSKLRGEQYNLSIRKLAQLGHKGAETVNSIEGEVVQPVTTAKVKQITGMSNIVKPIKTKKSKVAM